MSAIAAAYSDDIAAMREGLTSFVLRVVIPAHEKHADILESSSRRYDSRGRTSPDAWKIISEIRQKSAEAGFYTMCVPEILGGGGRNRSGFDARSSSTQPMLVPPAVVIGPVE